ncbi:MAG: hypothetical protein IPK73_00590 [Candidatus Obscuribacter sp.]|nr:hypothetical protein [Candidatus Obscuribacter sp.]MBK9280504.1 hypothetical protein [Candidatus Obscuribacter sp.]
MTKNFRQALYQLAQAQRAEKIYLQSRLQPFDASHLPQELYNLACRVMGVQSMRNDEVLPVFFSEEATAILMRMPNQYWMWWVLQQAVLSTDAGEDSKIGRDDIIHGVQQVRNQYAHKYNLRETIATLTPSADGKASRESKIASRAAEGLVLIKTNAFELDEMVDNPLFFDPQFLR